MLEQGLGKCLLFYAMHRPMEYFPLHDLSLSYNDTRGKAVALCHKSQPVNYIDATRMPSSTLMSGERDSRY